MIAAEMPCSARAATSSGHDGASAQSTLVATKPATPIRNSRLAPTRSASPPAGTRSAAMTTK
jgi:hypothetical protein